MPTKVPPCMMNHATNNGIAYLNPSYIKLCAPKPNNSKPSNIPMKSKSSIIFLPPFYYMYLMFNISINAKQSVPIPIRIPMIIKYKKLLWFSVEKIPERQQ